MILFGMIWPNHSDYVFVEFLLIYFFLALATFVLRLFFPTEFPHFLFIVDLFIELWIGRVVAVDYFHEIAVSTFYSVIGAGNIVFYSWKSLHCKVSLLICVLEIVKFWLTFFKCHSLKKLEPSGGVLYGQKCCCEKHSIKLTKIKFIVVQNQL